MRLLLLLLLIAPALSNAAITLVNASTSQSASDTSRTPTEPTSTAGGDIVIAVASLSSEDGTWTDPADFTQIDQQTCGITGCSEHVYIGYKIRGADAGSGYAFSYSGTASQIRVALYTFTGVNATQLDVTYSSGSHYVETQDSPTAANAAITTTTSGAVVFLAQVTNFSAAGTPGAPSGYTLDATGDGGQPQMHMAYKTVSPAGTETPGAWTHSGFNGGEDPQGYTIAIRPASTVDNDTLRRRR